jgi:hypothetical protein
MDYGLLTIMEAAGLPFSWKGEKDSDPEEGSGSEFGGEIYGLELGNRAINYLCSFFPGEE